MTWRRICKDPLMWRTIDMRNDGFLRGYDFSLEKMCRHAVDRSSGELEDINVEYFGTDDLLKYITNRYSIEEIKLSDYLLSYFVILLNSGHSYSEFREEKKLQEFLLGKIMTV